MLLLLKQSVRWALRTKTLASFVRFLDDHRNARPNQLRVLTYHRVDEVGGQPNLSPVVLSATPEAFARQMELLASHYHVMSMSDAVQSSRDRCPFLPRSVLITFDDAYRDFAQHAWPIAKQFGLPVTLFVPTAFPDQPARSFWWDKVYWSVCRNRALSRIETPWGHFSLGGASQRWKVYRRLCNCISASTDSAAAELSEGILGPDGPNLHHVLNWNELRKLAAEGVTLAPHTQTHPLMDRISLDRARSEAVGSREDLERNVGETLPVFAYPGGGFSQEAARMLEAEGFLLAFTTCRGANDLSRADRMRLRRINVGRSANAAMLQAQLMLAPRVFNSLYPLRSMS
jgi:peptidoglycan/xylan/chitin deacetylase (PgdA/CDA1 family)